jgi:hypothetical protein
MVDRADPVFFGVVWRFADFCQQLNAGSVYLQSVLKYRRAALRFRAQAGQVDREATKRGMLLNKYSLAQPGWPGDPRFPSRCLMVQGALAVGNAARSVQKEAVGRRAASEVALSRRLQRAKREGDLPKNSDPAELARYVMTVLQGMAVQGANGAGRDQLRRVAQIALRAWPKGERNGKSRKSSRRTKTGSRLSAARMTKDGNRGDNENHRNDYPAVAIKLLRSRDLVIVIENGRDQDFDQRQENEQGAD